MVDLQGLCGANPVPLNQGVLMALFLQLACNTADEISLKLQGIQRFIKCLHIVFGSYLHCFMFD
uniref:Uncharacterized protein n=1 Tax=Aegilops tauschii subsp. strangulata TaxID=200361 RepID=A0A453DHX6_AEGTS